ncbi:MAG TPA: heavy-metal-associated domain-containing protein [Myxococcota bacterium]|nr:heavy-metal-associated domain-containing protein [Myxococcota bacterium]HND31312.1 heavy-metal-associated domain-containing protein [Myxococcota bacterium]
METMTLKIEGMTCGGCVVSVTNALNRVGGVKNVNVSLEKKEAVVQGEGLQLPRLQAAVEDAGFDLGA